MKLQGEEDRMESLKDPIRKLVVNQMTEYSLSLLMGPN